MRKHSCILILAIISIACSEPPKWKNDTIEPFQLNSNIPKNSPLGKIGSLEVEFTGRYVNYTNADTWYPSWAANDTLYSSWTDGYIDNAVTYEHYDDSKPGKWCMSYDLEGQKASTAQAAIVGNDPMNLEIINLPNEIAGDPAPYYSRYPSANLVHNGTWYYGSYCLINGPSCGGVGWEEFGPFVGFRMSQDNGKTWAEVPHDGTNPLLGEVVGEKIKIGSPHFVDFGKNMQHSPDGYAYMVAHGTDDTTACSNWIQGDQIYLLRTKPSPQTINNASAWEFYAGKDSLDQPIYSSKREDLQPLISWPGKLGCTTITYNPGMQKYIMVVSRGIRVTIGSDEGPKRFDTMIMMADRLTGPWSFLTYWESFGPVAYFANFPSKFISNNGRTMWLCYSANFDNKKSEGSPAGSYYSMSLHEITLNNRKRK